MKTGVIFTDKRTIKNDKAIVVIQEAYIPIEYLYPVNMMPSAKDYLRELPEGDYITDEQRGYHNIYAIKLIAKGVAKCSSDDNFDETKGCHLAETRAQGKIFRRASLIFKDLLRLAENDIREIEKRYINCNDSYLTCFDHAEFDF